MSIIVSHHSAAFYWASMRTSSWAAAEKTFTDPTPSCATSLKELSCFNYDNPVFGGTPVHVLVPHSGNIKHTSILTCHKAAQSYPPGSFYKIRDGLFVSSPELCLLQIAHLIPLEEAIETTSRLCAHYFVRPEDDLVIPFEQSATTIRAVRSYIGRVGKMRRKKNLDRALQYAHERCESPMEIKLVMLLCLPYKYGGFGLPVPSINEIIKPGRYAKMVSQKWYKPDLSWIKKKTAVEYDGKESHEDSYRDKRRTNELEYLGWNVFMITKETLYSEAHFEKTAHQIARLIDHRIQRPESWHKAHSKLRVHLNLQKSPYSHWWY